ncbi:unnamed protein product [Paramecium primaurelia]|uniref:BART domain-containing protein n=1 Tax=Paramecium primaurelia TaxID=5886 RepID=A0A8S1MGL8_PARPR|nr:unnamed protein product [Paramecium primaurelia]
MNQNLENAIDIENDELIFENYNNDDQDDQLVSQLQEILISEDFEKLSQDFLREKCLVFDDTEQKEYREIFKLYQSAIQLYLNEKLKVEFTLEKLQSLPLDEAINETLASLFDYDLFKDIMVETRIRVEEEERTIKKSTNKATKGYKQAPQQNIFSTGQAIQFEKKPLKNQIPQDLRPDLFFNVVPLSTPKVNRKQA